MTGQATGQLDTDALSHPDYAQRIAATQRLLADEDATLVELVEAYRQARTPEARQRLRLIAQHHLIRQHIRANYPLEGRAGSVGVRQAGVTGPLHDAPAAVRVVETLAGFPAHERLLPDDLILRIDGETLSGSDPAEIAATFGERVRGRLAGSTVTLDLVRDQQPLTVRITLTPADALSDLWREGDHLRPDLDVAWRRLEQLLDAIDPITRELPVQAAASP